jgi:exosortase/archaeosortase family protein
MEAKKITVKYLVFYFAILILFYELFMLLPSTWIEIITAKISSACLKLLGFSSDYGITSGEVWMTLSGGPRDVHVYIIRECTAFHVWGILLGLIVPLRGPEWGRKMVSVAFGGILVFLMNITRIMVTVYLTGYDVPPFSWFFINPTVETYHYPVSFAYGVIGISIVIALINAYILPELGNFLVDLSNLVTKSLGRKIKREN